jgi:hypothetical protein
MSVPPDIISTINPTNKGQKMTVSIKHNLAFTTEVDENHPIGQRLLSLSHEEQVEMLESMLKELISPAIKPILDELNAGATYAILKVGA